MKDADVWGRPHESQPQFKAHEFSMPAVPTTAIASAAKMVEEVTTSTSVADASGLESLSTCRQWCYAVGQLGWSTLVNLVGFQLVFFYLPPKDGKTGEPMFPTYVTQDPFLVVLNVITLLATAGRLWDAVTDPLIASWSDSLDHRWGRRIPFLAAGGVPSAAFCALLFFPIVGEESVWNVIWLAIIQGLFYFAITVYVTPFFSLVSELGHTAQERLNLSTELSITFLGGSVIASSAPALGASFGFDAHAGLQVGVGVICVFGCLCMYVPVLTINERRYCAAQPSDSGVMEALRHCIRNRHFRTYVAADFSFWFGTSIITTGLPYFVKVLVQVDDGYMMVVIATIAVLSLAFYYPTNLLAQRFGKKRLVMVALVMLLVLFASIFFLGWLPFPGVLQIFAVGCLAAIPLAVLGVLPNAILADIAVHDGWQTGKNQEGMYFAARALLSKLGQSCGIMVFASLTNFGKDVGDDLGIRLSGPTGLLFTIVALVAFAAYREDEVLCDVGAPKAAWDAPESQPSREDLRAAASPEIHFNGALIGDASVPPAQCAPGGGEVGIQSIISQSEDVRGEIAVPPALGVTAGKLHGVLHFSPQS